MIAFTAIDRALRNVVAQAFKDMNTQSLSFKEAMEEMDLLDLQDKATILRILSGEATEGIGGDA